MSRNPFFSIVIPTYNRAKFIGKTLASVLAQRFQDFEVIIVDDGSTDDTENVISRITDDRVVYLKKENGERGAARNFGMDFAKGNFINFLDSDDIVYPHHLETAYRTVQTYDSPPFFHIAYQVIEPDGTPKVKVDYLRNDDLSIFIKGNPLSCMGVFLRKDISQEFRFVEDRELAGSEDWELWVRIASNFGIKTNNQITSALIDHNKRSVLNEEEIKLLKRKNLSLSYMFADEAVREKFSPYKKRMAAYCDTYIALHLVLAKRNLAGIRYYSKAIVEDPFVVFERRFLAVIKHLILNMLNLR